MDKHRVFLQQRKIRRLVAHAEEMRIACVRPELAWADAWPHLDDWFKLYGMKVLPSLAAFR